VNDASAVQALHARARDALARVEGELWSSAGAGFGGRQVLPRRFSTAVVPTTETERISSW
jgi:hypothetical protein